MFAVINTLYGVAQKTTPPCFTACNFGNVDHIGTKFGTNQLYFIHDITS